MSWQGFILVLMGACLSAFSVIINKRLLVNKAPDECVGTVNFLGGGLLLLLVSLTFYPPKIQSWFAFPTGLFWPLFATSLLNIVILFGSIKALKYGDASLVAPVSAAQPMIVVIPSWIILGEMPTRCGYLGLFLLAIGMYIFSFAEEVKGWSAPRWLSWLGKSSRYFAPWMVLFKNRGVQIALIVAVCGAVSINFDKLSAQRSSSTFAPACILLFCGLIGLIRTIRNDLWKGVSSSHLVSMFFNPIIFAIVLICYWVAFNYGMAAYVGALKRITVVFVLIFSWFILGEEKVKQRWPGALVMALGAALLKF